MRKQCINIQQPQVYLHSVALTTQMSTK